MRIISALFWIVISATAASATVNRAPTDKLIQLLPLYATDKGGTYVLEIYDLIGNRTRVSYSAETGMSISYVEYEVAQLADKTLRGRQNLVVFSDKDASGYVSSIESSALLRPGAEVEHQPVDAGNQKLYVDLVEDAIDYLENLKPEQTKKA